MTLNKMADEKIVTAIAEKSKYFNTLVELIPAKYYLPDDALDNKFTCIKGKSENISKQKKKELAKKAKLLKLDPTQHKSIADLQKEIDKKEKEESNDESSSLTPLKLSTVASAPTDELKKKLHERLSEFKRKRKISNSEAEKEDGGGSRKRKRKDKKDKDKKSKQLAKNQKIAKNVVDTEKKALTAKSKNMKVFKENGDLVFSKFDFAASKEERTKMEKKNKKDSIKSLLVKAEKQKEKIDQLEKDDKDKFKEIKTYISWDKALKHAEGVKVKDDPKLLKKSIKRHEKLKEHSSKKWQERKEQQNKQMEDKQKVRKQHLQDRKNIKLKKKLGKRGINITKHKPGF